MKKYCVLALSLLFLCHCDAAPGEPCGNDTGGLLGPHGSTDCRRGVCASDPVSHDLICFDEVALGEACEVNAQCRGEANNPDVSCNMGTCQPIKSEGGTCEYSSDCESTLWCHQSVCTPPQPEGMPCGYCQDGLKCLDSICRPVKQLGEICKEFDECKDSYCFKSSEDEAQGVCEAPRKEGDACQELSICEHGLVCNNGLCLPPQELGGPCIVNEPDSCLRYLNCFPTVDVTLPLSQDDLALAKSQPGHCSLKGRDNEPCDSEHAIECEYGWRCDADLSTCQRL